jgi:hypothetical protein
VPDTEGYAERRSEARRVWEKWYDAAERAREFTSSVLEIAEEADEDGPAGEAG